MDSNWLKKMYISHRGYHNDEYPENSLGAFKRAMDNGFAIELDVHILIDETVVVFHDNNFKRMTGFNKEVRTSTYDEIKDLILFDTNQKIPLFKDVLKLVDGKVPIMIELKSDGSVGRLESEVNRLLIEYKGQFVIQSFNPYSLRWFKINNQKIVRGQLSGSYKGTGFRFLKEFVLSNLLLNCFSRPKFIHYEIAALPRIVVSLYRLSGKTIIGWTARNRDQFEKAKKYCHNAVFEGFDPRE